MSGSTATGQTGVDVCLLNMPYGAVQRPSIATALLKSLLVRDGHSCAALYPNLWMAHWVGLKIYHLVDYSRSEDLIGEWTFAGVAFPDFEPDHETFLNEICERLLVSRQIRQRLGDGAELRQRCWQLRELASQFTDHVVDRVLELNPRIVGCTSTFQQHVPSLAVLRRLRERAPHIVTMMGGANCETDMGFATHRHFDWVDYVVSGEADSFFGELVTAALEHGRDLPEDRCPYGVYAPFHRRTGYPRDERSDLPRAITQDMAGMPVPDFSDYFETLKEVGFDKSITPGLLIETSRGCWWGARSHCTFCGLNGSGMSFRSRPAEEVFDELKLQSERHGLRSFEAVDNILDMRYFGSLLPSLSQLEKPYHLFYEIKSNMSRERILALKEAGIEWVQPGIESLSTELLSLMRKGVQAWQNVMLLKWCREVGIRLSWNFLFAFPGEKDEWYAKMADWLPAISHFQPPTGLLQVRIDRYSPYYAQRDFYGLELSPARCYQYVYPYDQEGLRQQAYFFEYEGEIDYHRGGAAGYAQRPGLHAVWKIFQGWLGQRWWLLPPVLSVTDEGETLRFYDTREVAVERTCLISGLRRQIYLLCEDGKSAAQLEAALAAGKDAEPSYTAEEIRGALDDLLARRFLLHLDDKYLGLGLRGAVPTLPKVFPGGMVVSWPKTKSPSLPLEAPTTDQRGVFQRLVDFAKPKRQPAASKGSGASS